MFYRDAEHLKKQRPQRERIKRRRIEKQTSSVRFCEGNQPTVKSAPYNNPVRRAGTEKEMGDVNLETMQLTIGLYILTAVFLL